MKREKELEAFERLLNIMDDLREKCPWDRKQTIDSLRPNTIEETYELADAILAVSLSIVIPLFSTYPALLCALWR